MNNNIYFIDDNLRIINVGGEWDEFAINNEGDDIVFSKIEGKSLLNYIKGDPTKMWIQTIIQLVKLKEEPIERPYRCDSPEIKRYMSMNISAESKYVLKFEHKILKVEPKTQTTLIKHFDNKSITNIYKRCSICGKILFSGKWKEPDADQSINISKFKVIYTVCGDCSRLLP